MKPFSTRILSLLLALVMVFSIMPSALAVDEITEEHIHTEECSHEETVIETEETEAPVTEETPKESAAEVPVTSLPVVEDTPDSVIEDPIVTEPAPTATSGYILGSSVYWEVSGGQLLISGSGDCPTFTSAADQPWAHLRNEITEVWFNSMDSLAISNLAYWFDGCTALTSAEIPYTTPVIGTRAFAECPNLNILQIYHRENAPTIASDAFYLSADSGVKLQILTITGYPEVVLPFHQYPWAASNRSFLYFGDVYGMNLMLGEIVGSCPSCGKNTLQGGYCEASHPHADYSQCNACGHVVYTGTYTTKNHGDGSWGSGTCPDCGGHAYYYSGTTDATCTERGYDTYTCACGSYYTQSFSAKGHSYYSSYSSYSDSEHYYTEGCYNCSYSSSYYESHSLSYGSWSNYSSTQHRRSESCYYCSYSGYDYANHSLSYGSWTNYSDTQHRRTVKCSGCSYSTYEYANHSTTAGKWTTYSDSQHKRTISCSCGYSSTEMGNHTDSDSNGSCDTCSYLMSRFSVTIPTTMTLAVSKHGEVYAANNVAILNHSTGTVTVSGVSITTANGWTLVPYTTNMANEKMDAKLIGFSINGAQSMGNGTSEDLSISGWNIAKGDSLSLNYDAVVSGSRAPINEQVLTVVFVLNWAA